MFCEFLCRLEYACTALSCVALMYNCSSASDLAIRANDNSELRAGAQDSEIRQAQTYFKREN